MQFHLMGCSYYYTCPKPFQNEKMLCYKSPGPYYNYLKR